MSIASRLREKSTGALWTVTATALSLYFAGHLLQGERGVVVWLRANSELMSVRTEATDVRADLQRKSNDVAKLQKSSLGLDHLDEAVRSQLNYAAPNEFIIRTPSDP